MNDSIIYSGGALGLCGKGKQTGNSDVVKNLRLEDKGKDLWSEDKDKDLWSEDKDKDSLEDKEKDLWSEYRVKNKDNNL